MKHIQQLISRLVAEMVNESVIKEEQRECVEFGMLQGLRTVVEIFLLILTGIVCEKTLQSIVILVAFVPLRVYAGGYHAKTPLGCAIKTWLLFTCGVIWLTFFQTKKWLEILTAIVVGILLFFWAPVQHKNKPLEDYEIHKYRKHAFLIWGVETMSIFIANYWGEEMQLSACVMIGMWMVIILMLAGYYENKRR